METDGPGRMDGIFLFMSQLTGFVTGQFTLRSGGRERSYTIIGKHSHPDVLLNFRVNNKTEFIFQGKHVPGKGVAGEFSGKLSGKATLTLIYRAL